MAIVDQQATLRDTSTKISSMVIALCLQSVAVVDQQAIFTDTSTRISSMVKALCPQSVAVVARQATFTDISTKISNMVIALYLQSWLSSSVPSVCGCRGPTSHIHRFFHQDK